MAALMAVWSPAMFAETVAAAAEHDPVTVAPVQDGDAR